MSSKADTIEEFVRSYGKGSYVGVNIDPKSTTIHPARIDVNHLAAIPGKIQLRYMVDASGKELSKEIDWIAERDVLIREYPKLGMLKVGPTIGYLSVKPLRQWKKGYYYENVQMHIPNKADLQTVRPRAMLTPASKTVVWHVYNREFWTVPKALELMEEGEGIGYPINYELGVYLRKDMEIPCVAYKNELVGSIDDNKVHVLHKYKLYSQQIERAFKMEVV